MKILTCVFLLISLSATALFGATCDPASGVVDSVHDMRNYGGGGLVTEQMDRVCAYCHTPHHAASSGSDYLPLWSRTLSQETLRPYWSETMQATINPGDFLMGSSKLCMSCHDGSIAIDRHYSFGGTRRLVGDDYLQANVGDYNDSTLTNDHPIGFIYDDVAAGTVAGIGTDSTGTKDNYIRKADANLFYRGNPDPNLTVKDRLYESAGYMTCATCHDVHNKKNADLAGAQNYLLLAPQSGSQLCLTCHIK